MGLPDYEKNSLPIRCLGKGPRFWLNEKIIEVTADALKTESTQRVDSLNTFMRDIGVPITNCVQNHFAGNIEEFLVVYQTDDKFIHSKFKARCDGSGCECKVWINGIDMNEKNMKQKWRWRPRFARSPIMNGVAVKSIIYHLIRTQNNIY